MAIFSTKKNTKSAKTAKAKASKVSKEAVVAKATAGDTEGMILRPRITEKSALLAEKGVYTFDVSPRANKVIITRIMKNTYGVTPLKIAIVVSKQRTVYVRGRVGAQAGGKKALVYLKKGDSIAFA